MCNAQLALNPRSRYQNARTARAFRIFAFGFPRLANFFEVRAGAAAKKKKGNDREKERERKRRKEKRRKKKKTEKERERESTVCGSMETVNIYGIAGGRYMQGGNVVRWASALPA